MAKKAAVITSVVCDGNTYIVTYASGVLKAASVDKMPATVKKWLDEHQEPQIEAEDEAVEIILDPLPERGVIFITAPEERKFTEEELDAFEKAFAADMSLKTNSENTSVREYGEGDWITVNEDGNGDTVLYRYQTEGEARAAAAWTWAAVEYRPDTRDDAQDPIPAPLHTEGAGDTETAVVQEIPTETEARQTEPPVRDVEDVTPGLLPRAAGAVVAGSLLLAVEAVYVAATAPLAVAAMVARWIAAALLALAGALDKMRAHAPQILDTLLDVVARGMDAVMDAAAWAAYQAVEIGTEVAWIAFGLLCTVAIKIKAAWDFRREVLQEAAA